MMKRLLDGAMIGTGIVAVLAVAIVIAWAGDIFTVDKDGVPQFRVSDTGKITVGATESYVNLVIWNNGAVPTNKVDITADVLTVEGIRLENVAVSANIETSGAGGLDTGSEAGNTWYYVWAITNNDGTLVNGILTLAPLTPNPPTPPVMPSGYTKKRRIGAVKNSSGNFLLFVQEGNKCNYLNGPSSNRILSAGQSITFTPRTTSGFIPPTCRRGRFLVFSQVVHTSTGWFSVYLGKSGSGLEQSRVPLFSNVANLTASAAGETECELDDNQQVDYKIFAVPATSGGAYIDVVGYYDRI